MICTLVKFGLEVLEKRQKCEKLKDSQTDRRTNGQQVIIKNSQVDKKWMVWKNDSFEDKMSYKNRAEQLPVHINHYFVVSQFTTRPIFNWVHQTFKIIVLKKMTSGIKRTTFGPNFQLRKSGCC